MEIVHFTVRFASGSEDGTVQVWDARTGSRTVDYKGHSIDVTSVAWSPDGSKIASGSGDGTVQIWDGTTGDLKNSYKNSYKEGVWIYSIAWSPAGKYIAVGNSAFGVVDVFEFTTNKHIISDLAYNLEGISVTWSPDSKYIAAGGYINSGSGGSTDDIVRIWEAITGKPVLNYKDGSGVRCIAWSPGGKYIASSENNGSLVWDATTGKTITVYDGHSRYVLSLVWLPDGKKIASGSADGTAQVWVAP